MPKQLTHEQAIIRMKECHNDFYDYSDTLYVDAVSKMSVSCPLHGKFSVTFSNHTHKGKARGCPDCGRLSRYSKRTLTVESFLIAAHLVHGDTYDYSQIEYKNTETKVSIVCKAHGGFMQSPEKHKAGRGCPICAGKGNMNKLRFIESATSRHGLLYDYSLIEDEVFKGTGSKVPIICRYHGLFQQELSNHLQGQGCRKCAKFGFSVAKAGTLYVLVDNSRVKIGITNRDVSIRVKEINKPNGNYKLTETFNYVSGEICAKVETLMLRFMRENYENTKGDFSGVSESFENVNPSVIINKIKEINGQHG